MKRVVCDKIATVKINMIDCILFIGSLRIFQPYRDVVIAGEGTAQSRLMLDPDISLCTEGILTRCAFC